MKKLSIFLFLGFCSLNVFSQKNFQLEKNKCGQSVNDKFLLETLGDSWGYNYDSLLNDIATWETSDYVQISSIGKSTLDRDQYELTITNPAIAKNLKHRIYIHARTHPNEVQAFWVTDEIINLLIQNSGIGKFLRDRCIFHIVPMYNPDGVELEYPRENANNVDIESNWGTTNPEIEVQNLRYRFEELMLEDNPIELALNMHSAYACKRYFVYHHQAGTSTFYTEIEKDFITAVRSQFMDGIEPWDYYVSWSNGTPNQYPESWWWVNYEEDVLALTYEDMNCEMAGDYNQTAYAILYGIAEHLGLNFTNILSQNAPISAQTYPNPFTNEISIRWANQHVNTIVLTDISGKTILTVHPDDGNRSIKIHDLNLPEGMYFLQLQGNFKNQTLKIICANP